MHSLLTESAKRKYGVTNTKRRKVSLIRDVVRASEIVKVSFDSSGKER